MSDKEQWALRQAAKVTQTLGIYRPMVTKCWRCGYRSVALTPMTLCPECGVGFMVLQVGGES